MPTDRRREKDTSVTEAVRKDDPRSPSGWGAGLVPLRFPGSPEPDPTRPADGEAPRGRARAAGAIVQVTTLGKQPVEPGLAAIWGWAFSGEAGFPKGQSVPRSTI